jgi:hypothetical protein
MFCKDITANPADSLMQSEITFAERCPIWGMQRKFKLESN